jgi:hypothetical protein
MSCRFSNECIAEMFDQMPRDLTVLELTYCYISLIYKLNLGNKMHTAKELNISYTSLKSRLKEMKYFGYHVEPKSKKARKAE